MFGVVVCTGLKLRDLRVWFLPVLGVSQLLLGSLQLLDYSRVIIYPTIHRQTLTEHFDLGFSLIVPLAVLAALWVGYHVWAREWRRLPAAATLVVALMSLEFGLALASLCMVAFGLVWGGDRDRFVKALLLVLAFFNGLGVIHYGVLVPLGLDSPLEDITMLQLRVHYVLGYLAPLLVLVFLYFWFLKPLVKAGGFKLPEFTVEEKKIDSFSVVMFLFSVFLAFYVALYPFFPSVNPTGLEVGVDVTNYLKWFGEYSEEVVGSNGVQRALFFHILRVFMWLTGLDLHSAIRFLPVFLNPLFVVASTYFVWECFQNSKVASWCAFLSATGYTLTVNMYSYFLTDTLALSLVLISLGLLFRSIREMNIKVLALASLLGCSLVFIHPWTLDQYMAGIVVLIGYFWYTKRVFSDKIVYFGGYLLPIGLSEMIKIVLLRSTGGVAATSTATGSLIGFGEFWFSSIFSFRYLYGGFMSNLVLLCLAIVGLYLIVRRDISGHYLTVFVLLSSLVFLLTSETIKSRLLFNTPFGLFGSLVLGFLRDDDLSLQIFLVQYSLFYLLLCVGNVVW